MSNIKTEPGQPQPTTLDKPKKSRREQAINIVANLAIGMGSISTFGGLANTLPALQNYDETRLQPSTLTRAESISDDLQLAMEHFNLDSKKPQDILKFQIKLTTLQNNVIRLQQAIENKDSGLINSFALTQSDIDSIRVLIDDPSITEKDWDRFLALGLKLENKSAELDELYNTIEDANEANEGLKTTLLAVIGGVSGMLSASILRKSNFDD
jgi:hypothetical protein